MNKSAILLVFADVIPGKEEEFNKWYNGHHIPEFSGKMPHLKSVRRYYSKKGKLKFIALYEYDSPEDLKNSLASKESELAGKDADKQIGILVNSFEFTTYNQVYPE